MPLSPTLPPSAAAAPSGRLQRAPLATVRLCFLCVPAGLLLAAFRRTTRTEEPSLVLGLAAIFQLLALVSLAGRWRSRPVGFAGSTYALYLSAWGCLWLVPRGADWFVDLSQGICLVIALFVFAGQNIADTGAPSRRRARRLVERLKARDHWPAEPTAYYTLPEVVALRQAIMRDAAPALDLLETGRLEAKLAALAALAGLRGWQRGQPEYVLALAQQSGEPAVRAAAIEALAGIDDRTLVELLGEYLLDESPIVRRAAAAALFVEPERRWPWMRHLVRAALGDPRLESDGPLVPPGGLLPSEAVKDLTAWAAEKGPAATRAAITLAHHFDQVLAAGANQQLTAELRHVLRDPPVPAMLKMELAQVLQRHRLLDRAAYEELLDPAHPAPLRLLAADALLAQSDHAGAVQALRDIGRLPNREIGLATADVLRRRLGVDLGLIPEQPPALHSRQAAMITRRVMAWAADEELPDELTTTMLRF